MQKNVLSLCGHVQLTKDICSRRTAHIFYELMQLLFGSPRETFILACQVHAPHL
jgi:hypothetical protein